MAEQVCREDEGWAGQEYAAPMRIERPSRYQSVTERLSSRLDALEPVVKRLLANEAKLIADSITAQARIAELSDYAEALRADAALDVGSLRTAIVATSDALSEFRAMSLWGRLRWLVLGR